MKNIIPVDFKNEETFDKGMAPDSQNWEKSFLSELIREQSVELSEIECLPLG